MPFTDELERKWNKILDKLSESITPKIVQNMFADVNIESFDGNIVVLSTSSEFRHTTLTKKYMMRARDAISDCLGKQVTVKLKYIGPATFYADTLRLEYNLEEKDPPEVTFKPPMQFSESQIAESSRYGVSLPPCNYDYSFDNFIVGSSNKFAHAAAVAVASRPAEDYNPLFIYGQSGLGKTHLLYAINNYITEKNPSIKILYVKGDDFTNQLIECLKEQKMERFRAKYRSCDVLLIDDIQFIAGKVATQEEFFHTFNSLYEEHKQIILTSDRPPSDIKQLEYRLKTRFEWGLIADIQPPEFELRLAITRKKAEQAGINIPDDVCVFLAENLRTNFRQVEGAVKKLRALSFLQGKQITMELARSCINELLGGAEPVSVTVDKIFSSVFKKYNISKEEIVGIRRTKEVAFARHLTAYLIRTITDMSLPNIGKILNRDHATVISSIEVIEKKLRNDGMFNIEVDELIKDVGGN